MFQTRQETSANARAISLQDAWKHVGSVNIFESYPDYVERMDKRGLSGKFNQGPQPAAFPVWEKAMELRTNIGGVVAMALDGIAILRR